MNQLKLFVVSFGFLGCSPYAPGTAGTLGGVLLALLLRGRQPFWLWSLAVCGGLYLVGRALGAWAESYTGRKDPGIFVLDEVIGYLVTILWVGSPSWLTLVLGFLVFRFFDIVKPPPARALERLGGGDGILLDDVAAGVWGLAVMAAARLLLPDLDWTV